MICARVPFYAILHDFQILQHQYAKLVNWWKWLSWSRDLSSTDLSSTDWTRHLWFKHLCLPWQPWCQAQRALSFCEGAQRLELTSVTAATPAPWDRQGWHGAWACLQTRRYCQDQAASSQKKSKKGGMFNGWEESFHTSGVGCKDL